jgi:hypothetical protein
LSEAKMGKQYRGQRFYPVRSVADIQAARVAQAPYTKEGAVPLHAFFVIDGVRDKVKQAAMRAYTQVKEATPEDWRVIFKDF